jgi:cobalamin biosynthesis protein CbiG
MTGILITAEDKSDLKLLTELAKRIGVKVKTFSDEEILDQGLLNAMEEGRSSEFVSREKIMEKLQLEFIS